MNLKVENVVIFVIQREFLFSDFKKNNGYLKSVKFATLYNLYRQNYCGCVYSYQDMLEREKNKEL